MSSQGEAAAHVQVTSNPSASPAFASSALARGGSYVKGWSSIGAQNAVGHEALMHDRGAAENGPGDAVVIDQVFQRLDHLGPAQIWVLWLRAR